MSRTSIVVVITIILSFVSLAVLTLFVLGVFLSSTGDPGAMLPGAERVALVRITGPIEDAADIVDEIDTYAESGNVRALVLRVDSPGGGVGASREIYEAVQRLRESGKPVVTSMGPIAASGGYYVACASDTIIAGPSTITGSIGVIATFGSFKRALDKIGLDFNIIATGPLKATGSEFKEMTDEERDYLQGLLDDLFAQFVEAISTSRGIDTQTMLEIADGRAFTGRQALELGLVDRIGTLDDALAVAARMAGLAVPPHVIERREGPIIDLRDLLREAKLAVRVLPRFTPRIEYRMY
ncbi:MAG: signal peptide peptidase SppA [bacterium]